MSKKRQERSASMTSWRYGQRKHVILTLYSELLKLFPSRRCETYFFFGNDISPLPLHLMHCSPIWARIWCSPHEFLLHGRASVMDSASACQSIWMSRAMTLYALLSCLSLILAGPALGDSGFEQLHGAPPSKIGRLEWMHRSACC